MSISTKNRDDALPNIELSSSALPILSLKQQMQALVLENQNLRASKKASLDLKTSRAAFHGADTTLLSMGISPTLDNSLLSPSFIARAEAAANSDSVMNDDDRAKDIRIAELQEQVERFKRQAAVSAFSSAAKGTSESSVASLASLSSSEGLSPNNSQTAPTMSDQLEVKGCSAASLRTSDNGGLEVLTRILLTPKLIHIWFYLNRRKGSWWRNC